MKQRLHISAVIIFFIAIATNQSFGQVTCIDSDLNFNGNDQYVKLAPNEFSNSNFLQKLTGDYTIECLVNMNSTADFQRIFGFSYGTDYFMFLTSSENANHVPRFAISTTGLSAPQVVDANIPLTQNVYHHIAVTYSKAASLVTLYIDGINVGSGTVKIDADSIYHGADMHDSSANYIGLSSFAGDPQLDGDIDEFRISDMVRYTGDYIPSLLPFVTDANTVALYHFDDGAGQMAADSSGNNYTAELGSTADADANDPSWVSCNTVLATSLYALTATAADAQVKLNWNAAYNINTQYYEIERSADAVHFTTINKVMQAHTTGNNYYKFTDASPNNGNNYYRIKQVNTDGSYNNSEAVYININAGAFKVYPTIAVNNLHISLSQLPSTIIIFNSTGNAVEKLNMNSTEQDINISELPAGNYIIRNITTGASLKFMKQQ